MVFNITLLILGLCSSYYLFSHLPDLKPFCTSKGRKPLTGGVSGTLSVIIPARNEEKTLPLLLGDLQNQSFQPLEVICVNDGSEDRTREVILEYGARLIDVDNKPDDWMGKAWACQKGSEAASGTVFLFLDADVRLSPDSLEKLMSAYADSNCTISVQPYHQTGTLTEELSLFFNVVQIGGNGVGKLTRKFSVGLFGPVILISQSDYEAIGGHRSAKSTIADDLALGAALHRAGKAYRLYLGRRDIKFRMYPGGFRDLFQGWTKNFATGASKTPLLLMIPAFLWVTSCTGAPIYFFTALFTGDHTGAVVYGFFYLVWMMELRGIISKVGNFSRWTPLFYPVHLLVFLVVFFFSLWKKLFRGNVDWKGRKIRPEG